MKRRRLPGRPSPPTHINPTHITYVFMINILRFQEWLLELKEAVNRSAGTSEHPERIGSVALAVNEGHLVRKLADRRGIVLCGRYPDSTFTGNGDIPSSENDVVLFLLEKVPSGRMTHETELLHYAALQRLMLTLRRHLLEDPLFCRSAARLASDISMEWEYDIFGGWNGLSAGFKLENFE